MQKVNIVYMSGAQIVVLNDAGWRTDTVESEAKVKLLLGCAVAEGRIIVERCRTQDFATLGTCISTYMQGHGVNDVDIAITLFIKMMYQVASHVF